MNEVYIPLFSALSGALIGSLSSIVSIYVQSRVQDRRERARLVFQVALEDHKRAVELVTSRRGRAVLPPVSVYVHFHTKLLELVEKNNLTPETMRELDRQQSEINRVIEEASAEKKDAT